MGLEMHLYKTKRVEGFSATDYAYANRTLDYFREKENAKKNKKEFSHTLEDWGVPESMTLEKAKVLESEYTDKSPVERFRFFTIFDELGYWKQANHIHAWFVKNVQGGTDNWSYYFVTKENLLELKEICEKVLALNPFTIQNHDLFSLIDSGVITKADYEGIKAKLEELMPTQEGFLFGMTHYNEEYFQEVKYTLEIAEEILKNGDFAKYVYFYRAWVTM